MLTYVPIVFGLYRPLKAHLRWTLQCLVAFADRDGKAFPSVRTLAEVAGIGKSTVSRHLAELTRTGIISRARKAGGVYVYQIDSRFLPAGAKVSQMEAKVSQSRAASVPQGGTEEESQEKQIKKKSALHSNVAEWESRLRFWSKFKGMHWNPLWGPRPNETGCLAPQELLATVPAGLIGGDAIRLAG